MRSRPLFMLLLLAVLWAPSFVFIKVAVKEIPALTLVLARVFGAALLLYLFLKLRRIQLPSFGKIWIHFAVMAFFAHVLPFWLITWGEIYIDSALAAILNGTTPIFTMVLAHFLIKSEPLTPARVGGVSLGFAGLFFLVAPNLLSGVSGTAAGIMAVTVAAASYGLAIVYARKHLVKVQPLVAPTAQLIIASIYLLPAVLVFDQPFSLDLPSPAALGSLAALSVLGTAVAFVLYYRIIEKAGANYLATVTYLMPIFGLILGITILGERISWNAYLGCALILLGVMLANGVFRRFEQIGKRRSAARLRKGVGVSLKKEVS